MDKGMGKGLPSALALDDLLTAAESRGSLCSTLKSRN